MPEIYGDLVVCNDEKRLEWFKAAKFGMFIHWGIYAQLAGEWKGKPIPGIGEQIMRFAEIPAKEYELITKEFNPYKFDADEWVTIAKKAGMKYIVITAKHHDGFAMYHSKCSPYNIVDATPYKHDPMADLARACQKEGIKLCFYYSHYQDWHHPNGEVHEPQWDKTYPREDKTFEKYMDEKAIPQVVELLTGYGPVGLIWYDTPGPLSYYNSKRFCDLVHAIQPECIVSPRVGHGLGDYQGYRDNQVPVAANTSPWETCATMNDTWGFKKQDHNWKDPGTLIRLLVSIVSKGGNYLLNVGPTCEGLIPQESIDRLETIGEWIGKNGEAIYNAVGCIMPYELEWGALTGTENKLYLHIFDWKAGDFILNGLKNKVKSAYVLSTNETISFSQEYDDELDIHKLNLRLVEKAPDKYVSVIALDIEGYADMDTTITEYDSHIVLNGFTGKLSSAADNPTFVVSKTGTIEQWQREEDMITWHFKVAKPSKYSIEMNTFTEKYSDRTMNFDWEGGHEFELSCNGQKLEFTITDDERIVPRDLLAWRNVITKCGEISFEEAGEYTMILKPKKIYFKKELGPKFKSIVLKI